MSKPTICMCENKVADQLRSNCVADWRLCFRYTDWIIPLLPSSEISSFKLASVTVQAGLCWTKPKFWFSSYRRIGYNLNVMRQSACLVFNPITVDNYAAFFNCTPVGRASDSMMAPT